MFLVHPVFDAILLAGGRASRVGGADKTAFTSRGATLLDRAAEAALGARSTVIVGLRDGVVPPPGTILTREDPPWSGPVPALAAGLAALPSPSLNFTLVLACDLPRAPEAVVTLLAGLLPPRDRADGFIAVDDDGRRQPLLALYRTAALVDRLTEVGPLEGLSLRRLLEGLTLVEVAVPTELSADVDTAEDARRLGVAGAPDEIAG